MSSKTPAWASLCERLNVKPRQFAILLTITLSAVGVLGLKVFVFKPAKAGAATTAARAPVVEAGVNESGASETDASRAAANMVAAHGLPIVAISFETRPLRDPFAPFFVYDAADNEGQDGDSSGANTGENSGVLVAPRTNGPGPGAGSKAHAARVASPIPTGFGGQIEGPEGLTLKAIISGRVAVLNSMSVEVGDVVQDASGQNYTVAEIHERNIVLSDGPHRFTLGYSALPPGGSKSPAAKAASTKSPPAPPKTTPASAKTAPAAKPAKK